MKFPNSRFNKATNYVDSYFQAIKEAAASIDRRNMEIACSILAEAYIAGRMVYSCGNGGSAAIANHLVCDHCKMVRSDTSLGPRIVSLSSPIEMITAIANDISYDEIFAYQLRALAEPGDVLLTISSSGDSENIVRAAKWARQNKLSVIAMTGFSGGRSSKIADINLHVDAENYGIVEDIHQSLMHILAQFIRQAHMEEDLIKQRRF